jgi:hypothetical protein
MYYQYFLPPLHPSLAKNGLPLEPEIVVPLVKEALGYTIQDLNPTEISDDTCRRFWFRGNSYPKAKKEAEKAKLKYTYDPERPYTMVYNIPMFIGDNRKKLITVCIEPKGLSPEGGDEHIIIQGAGFFNVPKKFSEDMLNEYDLRIESLVVTFEPDKMEVISPYGWHHHNVIIRDSILYKNLIIAMNNWAVAKKYEVSE